MRREDSRLVESGRHFVVIRRRTGTPTHCGGITEILLRIEATDETTFINASALSQELADAALRGAARALRRRAFRARVVLLDGSEHPVDARVSRFEMAGMWATEDCLSHLGSEAYPRRTSELNSSKGRSRMSDRCSNLSFNLVDWDILRALRGSLPNRLEAFLCEVKLPEPTESDRSVIQRLNAGEFPEPLDRVFFLRGLRIDRPQFAARLAKLHEADPGWVARELEELSFIGGSTRMFGDLWLASPCVIACCADSNFAKRYCEGADEAKAGAPPFVPFESSAPMMRVLGLEGAADPLDQTFEPEKAGELADALDGLSLDDFKMTPRARFQFEQVEGWERESLGPIDDHVRDVIDEIRRLFRGAREKRLGVDTFWHPNP